MCISCAHDPEPPPKFSAPSDLMAKVFEDTKARLVWKDNTEEEAGFVIERRSSASAGVFALLGKAPRDATTFTDKKLLAAAQYTYRVYAFRAGAKSGYSNVAAIKTPKAETGSAPEAPEGLTAVLDGATAIRLTWQDVSVTETGFQIERRTLGGTFAPISAEAPNSEMFLDTGLAAGAAYEYRMYAFNDEGQSPYTAVIRAGCFAMGDALDGMTEAMPVHDVCLASFSMDASEVTNAQYAACVVGGECTPPVDSTSKSRASYYGNADFDTYPVVFVDRDQAATYCQWNGKRLPTEAEWEIAARGGLAAKRYPWGNVADCAEGNVVVEIEFSPPTVCQSDTTQVGSYPANGYGLYDMVGNVWEWVSDWYGAGYYAVSPAIGPTGPASGSLGVIRGGSYSVGGNLIYTANRFPADATTALDSIGFRCVR